MPKSASYYEQQIYPKLDEIKALRQQGLSVAKLSEQLDLIYTKVDWYKRKKPELKAALEAPPLTLDERLKKTLNAPLNRQKRVNNIKSFMRHDDDIAVLRELFRMNYVRLSELGCTDEDIQELVEMAKKRQNK